MNKTPIPNVPLELNPSLRKFLQALKESAEISMGARGNLLNKSLTVGEFVKTGLGQVKNGQLALNAAEPASAEQGDGDLNPPSKPEGLLVEKGISSVFLVWDKPSANNISHVNVYRADTNNFANAVLISNVAGFTHVDYVPYEVVSEITGDIRGYYYWIALVSTSGVVGPPNDVNGVYQEPIKNGDDAFQFLSVNRLIGDIGNFITANINNASITSAMIAQVIKSDIYDADNGWAINKDGLAVFNNIYARGVIEGSTIRGSIMDGGVFIGGTDVTIPTDIDGGPGTVPRYLCYADYSFSASCSHNNWSANSNFLAANYEGEGTYVEGTETLAKNFSRVNKQAIIPDITINYSDASSGYSGYSDRLYYNVQIGFRDQAGNIFFYAPGTKSWYVPYGSPAAGATKTHTDGNIEFTVTLGWHIHNVNSVESYESPYVKNLSVKVVSPMSFNGDSEWEGFVYCRYYCKNGSWRTPSTVMHMTYENGQS